MSEHRRRQRRAGGRRQRRASRRSGARSAPSPDVDARRRAVCGHPDARHPCGTDGGGGPGAVPRLPGRCLERGGRAAGGDRAARVPGQHARLGVGGRAGSRIHGDPIGSRTAPSTPVLRSRGHLDHPRQPCRDGRADHWRGGHRRSDRVRPAAQYKVEAVDYLRIVAPSVVAFAAYGILSSVCQAEAHFGWMAMATIAISAVSVAVMLLLWPSVGLLGYAFGTLIGPFVGGAASC